MIKAIKSEDLKAEDGVEWCICIDCKAKFDNQEVSE